MTIELTGPLLRTSEAAAFLGLSEKQVGNLRRRGILPAVRMGFSVRFHQSDVARLARERDAARR